MKEPRQRLPVRVAFFGNVANSHFRAAEALRKKGLDAHLYISDTDSESSRPESSEPAMAAGYPDWIHLGNWIRPSTILNPLTAPITKHLADFDAIVASGPGPVYAQFARKPWAFMATGGDLTVKPFPLAFMDWYPSWPHRMAEAVAGMWQRRASRRADQLWLQPFAPMVGAADRLGIPSVRRVDRYFPLVVDTNWYSPAASPDASATAFVANALGDADFVVFHPSRLVMNQSEKLVRTGQWKGNDRLLRGFADFVRRCPASNSVLVLPDSPLSRDLQQAKSLAFTLGIEQHLRWIRPPDGRFFDSDHMLALYQRSDVVCDEFGVGWFGYVTLEGLSTGRPVLSHVDEAVMGRLYPSNPIVDAKYPHEIAARLTELHRDPARREAVGRAGRSWAEKYHSPSAAPQPYLDGIRALLDSSPGASG